MSDGKVCTGTHTNVAGATVEPTTTRITSRSSTTPSTANPQHLPPTSIAKIGHQDQANHQYDLKDFCAAADDNNMPAVSYLKAPAYEDGHAGYSDPLDEQHVPDRDDQPAGEAARAGGARRS